MIAGASNPSSARPNRKRRTHPTPGRRRGRGPPRDGLQTAWAGRRAARGVPERSGDAAARRVLGGDAAGGASGDWKVPRRPRGRGGTRKDNGEENEGKTPERNTAGGPPESSRRTETPPPAPTTL